MRCALHNCEGAKPIEERKEKKKKEMVFGDSWRFRSRVFVSVCVSSEYRTNIGTNGGTG